MQDKHKGFFLFVVLAIPIAMLGLAFHFALGICLAIVALMVAKITPLDTWAEMGNLVDSNVLTLAVLVGGSVIVFAQSIASAITRIL